MKYLTIKQIVDTYYKDFSDKDKHNKTQYIRQLCKKKPQHYSVAGAYQEGIEGTSIKVWKIPVDCKLVEKLKNTR